MLQINVTYQAQSLDEVKSLLLISEKSANVEIKVASKEPIPGPTPKEVPAKPTAPEYTVSDIQAMAIEANEKGQLSKVKEILDTHGVARVAEIPDDKITVIAEAIKGISHEGDKP